MIGDRFDDQADADRRWGFIQGRASDPGVDTGEFVGDPLSPLPPQGDWDGAAAGAAVEVLPGDGLDLGIELDRTYLRHWVLTGDTVYTVVLTYWTPSARVEREDTLAAMQAAADEMLSRVP